MAIVLSLTTLKITTFSGCPGTISCMWTVALPFGLRPAPFIFTQFAEAWHWILQHRHGICYLLHYLDDYITVGASNSRECHKNLSSIGSYSSSLGIPLTLEKIEGPSTVLSFLGIKLVTFLFVACLWAERVSTLQNLLQSWSNKHICRHHFPSPSCCKSGLPWQPLYLLFNWSQSWYVFSVPAYLPKQRHRGWFTLVVILPLRLEQYQLLYFSSFGLTCWTYRCPPMLQELLGLVPILMAFGLQSLASQAAVCVHQL